MHSSAPNWMQTLRRSWPITRFEKEFFEFLDTKYPEVPGGIARDKVITDEMEGVLQKAIEEFKKQF